MAGDDAQASLSVQVYLGIVLFALFPICVFIVAYYAEPGFPWRTYITLVLGYYASFGILLTVPIDIASVVFDRLSTEIGDSPSYDADKDLLSDVYNTFFTMVLILGSFVLILEEYFNSDGYFTFGGKMGSSLKRMAIDNGVALIAGVIILAILIGQHVVSSSSAALMLTAVIVTNTVYETFLMFLLGYALIEYPRELWNQSDLDAYLLRVQMRASAEFKAIQDHQLTMSLCVSDVLKTAKMVSTHSEKPVQDAMAILVSECPSEFRSDRMGTVAADKKGRITIDTLAALRTRLNLIKSTYKMSQAKVEGTKILAYTLEDIVAAKADTGANTIHWSLYDKDSTVAEYNWHIKWKPMWMKVASVCCFVLSIFSFLGVVCSMMGVANEVSVYYLAVHDTVNANRGGIALFILITLGYTVFITTWALFQMKIAGCMEMVPYRTTPVSLSFNVRMNARLAAPMAFFYLGWMAENGIKTGSWLYNDAPGFYGNVTRSTNETGTVVFYNETVLFSDAVFMPSAFSNFYQLQSVGAIKSTFGTIFPILLFCVLFLFVINAFNRILVLLKLDEYQFGAALVTEEQLREGKRQLQRTRKATERSFRRDALKSFIQKVAKIDDGESGASFWSRFFGGGGNRASKADRDSTDEPVEKIVMKEPTPLSAKVEKKTTKGAGGSWKTFYAEVRSPGFLHFYKDKKAASDALARSKDPSKSADPNCLVVNLTAVNEFTIPDRKNKDNNCVDLDIGSESMRIKFKDYDEAVTWKHKLQEWKDWNNDFGATYPMGLAAGPGGAGAASATKNPLSNPVASAGRGSTPVPEKNDDFDFGDMNMDLSDDEDKGVRPLMKGKGNSSSSSNAKGSKSSTPAKPSPVPAASARSGGGGGGKTISGFGAKKSSYDDDVDTDTKPALVEGWVEKKGGGRVKMGDGWQKRYLRIDEKNACLSYFKTSSPTEQPAGMIDLKVVKDITPYEKGGKEDFTRFNVDVDGDKMYKFKVNSQAEGQRWVEGLNEWRDYFLMNM